MNKLQLPQAKLLYAVSELYRTRRIDETEKRVLKCICLSIQKKSLQITLRSMRSWSKTKQMKGSFSKN